MRRFLAAVTILLFPFSFNGENLYKIRLGEIIRVDPVTGVLDITVHNPGFEYSLKNRSVETLIVLEENSIEKKELRILSYEVIGNKIIVHCKSTTPTSAFFVGQQVGLLRSVKSEPAYRDKITRENKIDTLRYNDVDGSQMVLIPEGPFIFGSDIAGTDHYTTPIEYELTEVQKEMGRKRVRYLHMNGFYMDKFEITVGQFEKYLRETASEAPPGWQPGMYGHDESLPAINLSFTMAEKYCKWAGKRLPTELEWEKASRGPGILASYMRDDVEFYREKINVYPTGLTFDEKVCVTSETSTAPMSVNHLKDANHYGLYGMCGNAAEWTSSWFLPYRGNTKNNPDYGRKFKVIRGGSYNLPSKWTKSYERMIGGIPTLGSDYRAGVRCAMDP